jgi:hypothetical protein
VTRGIDALPATVRDRLRRFGERIERQRVDELAMFAARPAASDHAVVLDRAMAVAAAEGRSEAVEDARATMVEFLMRSYAGGQYRPTWIGLNWAQSLGTTDDRVRVSRSLGEAVVAVVLWDRLEPGDRDELLGAWSAFAE